MCSVFILEFSCHQTAKGPTTEPSDTGTAQGRPNIVHVEVLGQGNNMGMWPSAALKAVLMNTKEFLATLTSWSWSVSQLVPQVRSLAKKQLWTFGNWSHYSIET